MRGNEVRKLGVRKNGKNKKEGTRRGNGMEKKENNEERKDMRGGGRGNGNMIRRGVCGMPASVCSLTELTLGILAAKNEKEKEIQDMKK